MKKITILLFAILCFACGEKDGKATKVDDTLKERDKKLRIKKSEVQGLLETYHLEGDANLLAQALVINDAILREDFDFNKRSNYKIKSQILAMQGKDKEAFTVQDSALVRDNSDVERLRYDGLRYALAGKKDSARINYRKALMICNTSLEKIFHQDWVMQKVKIYCYTQQRDSARITLEEAIKQDPDNRILKSQLKTINQNYQSTQDMIERLK